jgi:putative redox protein
MQHEITCEWTGDMSFEADVLGHKVRMDAGETVGGHDSGAPPKPLVLVALAGCSGMDVVSILKKMREPITWFDMKVRGDVSEGNPKTYTSVTIVYEFKAADGLKDESVQKAVSLSQERYCGVSALLKKAIPVKWEIVYL